MNTNEDVEDSLITGIIASLALEILIDLILWAVEMIAFYHSLISIHHERNYWVYLGETVKGVIDIFTFTRLGSIDNCKNAGEGIFGLEESRIKNGRVLTADNNAGKNCVKPTTLKILITMLCPPWDYFFTIWGYGWFHVLSVTFLTVKLYYFRDFFMLPVHLIC